MSVHVHEITSLRVYAYLSSLSVLLYEHISKFPDEVELIWRRPFNHSRIMFVLCRYLALSCQIISLVVFFALRPDDPYSRRECFMWHTFQTATFQILLFTVESIQATKLQALYVGHTKKLYALYTFRGISFCATTYTTIATLLLMNYDGACVVSEIPWHVVGFGALAIITQAIVTLAGLSISLVKDIVKQNTLISIMARDSLLTFGLITGIYPPYLRSAKSLADAPLLAFSAVIITHADVIAPFIPSFFISTLSISGCRMIFNILAKVVAHPDGETLRTASVPLSMFLDDASSLPTLPPEVRIHH
ncbi:hypothetical protein ONZ45_g7969 [Pleurotus djamor]|nr:hypothetical protein ONZ45_g7969 [Pleurotus djamor]